MADPFILYQRPLTPQELLQEKALPRTFSLDLGDAFERVMFDHLGRGTFAVSTGEGQILKSSIPEQNARSLIEACAQGSNSLVARQLGLRAG